MPGDNITRRDFVAGTAKFAAGALIAPPLVGAPMIVPRHVLGGPGYQAPSDTLNIACVGIGGMGMQNLTQLLGENIVAICDVDFPYVERSLAGRLGPRQPRTPPAGLSADQARAWQAAHAQEEATASAQAQKLESTYTKARKYADFREMLDKQRGIDAVVVATPDHAHAAVASRAMQAGKHVYVQKPLTYSVHEARTLAGLAASSPKLVTQMGNQGHSLDGTRRIKELIAAGVIGPVREVHVWTDRPQRYWAQGIPRPEAPTVSAAVPAAAQAPAPGKPGNLAGRAPGDAAVRPAGVPPTRPAPGDPATVPPRWNMRTVDQAVLKAMAENPHTPPPGLHWDLFLGPAGDVPYHPAYHPFSWRGWTNFGVSAIGDMGAHLIDQPYWALDLGLPTAVSSSSTPWGGGAANPASYPLAQTVEYEFPARGERPPVKLFWYDGGMMPPRPPFLPDEMVLPRGDGGGGVFVGTRGILVYETYGNNPTIYPAAVAEEGARVAQSVPRITVPHEVNWVQACKGQAQASSPFAYAAALTEVMLLGIVALRAGQGRKILYDGANMRVTNAPEANQYLTREYRAGWTV